MSDSSPVSPRGPVRIGQPVRRLEDAALLTGTGRFLDDIDLPGQLHAWFVRSPHAHARVVSVAVGEALAMPGVEAVLTGEALEADGIGALRSGAGVKGRDGRGPVVVERPALVRDRVRHVGDTVAMVVAASPAIAREAAERVEIDYEPLDAVVGGRAALEPGAPSIWEEAPGNVALDWEGGDPRATEQAFRGATRIVRIEAVVNRVAAAPLETRGALGTYDPHEGRYTLYTPTQGSDAIVSGIAATGLVTGSGQLRVVTPDVGGSFGMKIPVYPEQLLVLWAARRLGRPVKWYADRSDAFLTDGPGRDHFMAGELALDAQGRFLAIRTRTVSDTGAYTSGSALTIPTVGGVRCITGVYAIPCYHAETRVAFTNTTPIEPYRGAGKPEYSYLVERLVDAAARETGIDPAELRRRNVVPPEAMPWRTPAGLEFDSGEFARNMDDALVLADRAGFPARREEAARRGRLRGLGFSVYQEPDGYMDNRVSLVLDPQGGMTVTTTAQTNGQGHVTTFAQVISDRLGLPLDRVRIVQGDSDRVGHGSGTGGSRVATVSGTAIVRAAEIIVDKGRRIAGHLLEASPEDVEFADGRFTITGTDRGVDLAAVARLAYSTPSLPPGMEPGLEAVCHHRAPAYNYPSGCHVCEVEVDPDTGRVAVVAYAAVNDFGVVINPLLLEGQVHGGIVQGIGQALLEEQVYDPDGGQLLTGSFMDYCLPRATDVPVFTWGRNEVPCRTNPLGVKGCGESGCTGSLAAVMNAVVDALAPLGVTHVDMPATPERVWRLCRDGARGSGLSPAWPVD